MKISLHWLYRYLLAPVPSDQVQECLDRQGFPIEACEPLEDGDFLIDAEVTSNRSDCLSHLGLAREVAAGEGLELQPPVIEINETGPDVQTLAQVDNQDEALCPVYTARVIQGIKVGPSPNWLVKALESIGLRSVNNVVDVTNFVLMEMGQPLHTFDLAKLAGQKIVVRKASTGEKFKAIDGTSHTLNDTMLVIADAEKPVAVAGVMGGLESEVTETTTDILLESARFDALSVRTTGRRLKLSSDSSYRFERGVDPLGVERASMRAAQLICELTGGSLATGVIRVGEQPPLPQTVSLHLERCNDLIGVTMDPQQVVQWLDRLQLSPVLEGDKVVCTIPTWRADLQREIDLVEEVVRMFGLDNIPTHSRISIEARPPQVAIAARQLLTRVLVAHGYYETINFSFVNPKQGMGFVPKGEEALQIDDERRKAEPMLRPSALPSLLACRKSNQDMGNQAVQLFELASVWVRFNGKIVERRELALLADVAEPGEAIRRLRGLVSELVERLGGSVSLVFKQTKEANYSDALAIEVAGQRLGTLGLVEGACQNQFDLQTAVVGATFDLDALIGLYPPQRTVAALCRFPGIERDLSVIVDNAVTWDQLSQEVRAAEPQLLEDLRFITTYRGKPIAKGQKSVSFRLSFRDPTATLRHDQVDPQMALVVDRLKQSVGAQLRD